MEVLMADYDVYAVKKDSDGDITHCYVESVIIQKFSTRAEAKTYIKNHCELKTKQTVIDDINNMKNNTYTKILKYTDYQYEFELGAKIHVVANRYLRTDANSTTKDNLDDILEID